MVWSKAPAPRPSDSRVCCAGLRPYGVSFLFGGWDKHRKFQLYHSDPSGNFGGWKATAIGSNFQVRQCKHACGWRCCGRGSFR